MPVRRAAIGVLEAGNADVDNAISKGALQAGATTQEIMDVLKLCVAQGVQAANLGVAILAEELNGAMS
ncbi:MAG TPA: hypothetical protein VLZ05_01180 [Mycobacterium sp.]|nr:hypothetical protein [Mycobacterium sp.]HUH67599.1 hypothetical protein [Mycobacterium sp.]